MNIRKKDLLILGTILAAPFLIGLSIAAAYKFQFEKSEWIMLVTSCLSSSVAIILGYMVFFQAEHHRNREENALKRNEEQTELYREEEQKHRKQELLLKANPHAAFNNIECLRYANAPMLMSKESKYNRLTNVDFEKFHNFLEHVYMDLNFNVPNNNVVERIHIRRVGLKATKGKFHEADFKEYAEFDLYNRSYEMIEPNIKVRNDGSVDALLSLLFDIKGNVGQCDIKNLLNNKDLEWTMRICYTLSNSFDIEIGYETYIKFALGEGEIEGAGEIKYPLSVLEGVTIQTTNIGFKENMNELNA